MLESLLNIALVVSLALHVALLAAPIRQLVRGKTPVDRLLSLELITILLLCVVVLIALITRQNMYVDVALALAALSFISTLALAKYLANQRMF